MAEPLKIFCGNCEAKLDVSDFLPFDRIICPICGTRLRVPRRFERYLIERECGHGGVAVVCQAIEPQLVRRVAIKLLIEPSPDGQIDPQFLNVAKLIARISHSGFIPIYRCGCCENHSFLAMRFMEHGDLERLMLSRQLPNYPIICHWIGQVSAALEFAWQHHQIVHHDVKPSNIMLTQENEAKLGDFDLADQRELDDFKTQCGEWGSPAYVSPERLMYGGEDFRGDIFSLGVTLFELLSGRAPFGISGEAQELYRRREVQERPQLPELTPFLPPELVKLIDQMLEFKPENRPGFSEVIDLMRDLAREAKLEEWQPEIMPPEKRTDLPEEWYQWFGSRGE